VRDGGLAVLTCAANEACARLHDRMPVVLAGPAEERAWLDGPLDDALVGAVCAPLPAARVTIAAADATRSTGRGRRPRPRRSSRSSAPEGDREVRS
jgi:putative SOS response-associated peptidase YedK